MGLKDLEALVAVLQAELAKERGDNMVLGTWHIHYEQHDGRPAFSFNKCESEVYCEERPTVIAADGEVLDAGGPLFPA